MESCHSQRKNAKQGENDNESPNYESLQYVWFYKINHKWKFMEHVSIVHCSSCVGISKYKLLWSCISNAPSPFYPFSNHGYVSKNIMDLVMRMSWNNDNYDVPF